MGQGWGGGWGTEEAGVKGGGGGLGLGKCVETRAMIKGFGGLGEG